MNPAYLSFILLSLVLDSSPDSTFHPPDWQVREFHAPGQLLHEVVRDIQQAPDGSIWMATWGSGVVCFHQGTTVVYNTDDGLLTNDTRCLAIDRWGGVWVGTPDGINYIQPDRTIFSFSSNNLPVIQDDSFFSVAVDAKGNAWFGSSLEQLYTCKPIESDRMFPYGDLQRIDLALPEKTQGIRISFCGTMKSPPWASGCTPAARSLS